jgi:hypothetical protein
VDHSNHEIIFVHPAAHVAVEHERQPAEHSLFFEISFSFKDLAYTACELFIIGHAISSIAKPGDLQG